MVNTSLLPIWDVLPILLTDRTTRKNIIFATERYSSYGAAYSAEKEITVQLLSAAGGTMLHSGTGNATVPRWQCCRTNDEADARWFDRPGLFGHTEQQRWIATEGPVALPLSVNWKRYIDARRLECRCGEAPHLVQRYDGQTGECIALHQRGGMLDRKLRLVGENAETEAQWVQWAQRAFESVYGYEYRGDLLLLARIHLLLSFTDYLRARWQREPYSWELRSLARVISWNLWQMDGETRTVPLGAQTERQLSLFRSNTEQPPVARIFDWRGQNKSLAFDRFCDGRCASMKFDCIVENGERCIP